MFDLITIIKAGGYLAIAGIVFAESGLLIGFFLPGDSLLFMAGFLASQHFLNLYGLIVVTFVAAVVGDSVGFEIGRKIGPKIFVREESIFFSKEHVRRAHEFYEKHGGRAITFARFIPVVRTFAPVVAGVGCMKYRTFLLYNIIGAFLWAVGLPLAGYFAGAYIPNVDQYILPIVAGIILLSILPSVIHFIKHPDEIQKIILKLRTNRCKK